jgi:Kef-type K+ transport system membrane component KefB
VGRVSFATLALIAAVAVLGRVLALRRSWHLPVVLGELAGGIALGNTGLGLLRADNDYVRLPGRHRACG